MMPFLTLFNLEVISIGINWSFIFCMRKHTNCERLVLLSVQIVSGMPAHPHKPHLFGEIAFKQSENGLNWFFPKSLDCKLYVSSKYVKLGAQVWNSPFFKASVTKMNLLDIPQKCRFLDKWPYNIAIYTSKKCWYLLHK